MASDARISIVEPIDGINYTTLKSSNCYILNPSEYNAIAYYIPISTRINEYWGSSEYGDNSDYCISSGDEWTYEVLWYDNSTDPLVEDISELSNSKLMIEQAEVGGIASLKVTLGENFNNMGNVLVAVKKGGVIVWSWHLWITDYNPYDHGITDTATGIYPLSNGSGSLHRYGDASNYEVWSGNGIYKDKYIMDRNIGARSVNPSASNPDGFLYYQFGRKEPFPYAGNAKKTDNSTYTFTKPNSTATMNTAVQNPSIFYASSSNWCSNYTGYKYLWCDPNCTDKDKGEKSIFDPSPYGFRLPIYKVWNGFDQTASGLSSGYNGRNYTVDGVDFYYPRCGYLAAGSGVIDGYTNSNYYVLYSCAIPEETTARYTHAYALANLTGDSSSQNTLIRSGGIPLRCIEDVPEEEY